LVTPCHVTIVTSGPSRLRITVDVTPELRKRLRVAAAQHDVTVGQYVVEALRRRLLEDLGEEAQPLTAESDPVLAELWDNAKDAAYDRR
jgi:hypothetical protein